MESPLLMSGDQSVVLVPMLLAHRTHGLFVLARLASDRRVDPRLLAELVQRGAYRFEALQLMRSVHAPLADYP